MPLTDIKVSKKDKNIIELIIRVEDALRKGGYLFLSMAFRQKLIYSLTEESKIEVMKEYVTLVD